MNDIAQTDANRQAKAAYELATSQYAAKAKENADWQRHDYYASNAALGARGVLHSGGAQRAYNLRTKHYNDLFNDTLDKYGSGLDANGKAIGAQRTYESALRDAAGAKEIANLNAGSAAIGRLAANPVPEIAPGVTAAAPSAAYVRERAAKRAKRLAAIKAAAAKKVGKK
jgi:hypothetical protein